ncbi:RNA polymerase sigma factor [Streptomyces sp. CoH27]|uniref:RNA polymerase sigma factor n=1 Tax=Streptomyces sp. CoH27 TaxID=2875763 RepID=UPI001CD233A1|nr:sigma-70 family RNA polymerase sigma factor [Streptomyces sp. CoH27]
MERKTACGVLEHPTEHPTDRSSAPESPTVASLFSSHYAHLLRLARLLGAEEESEDLVAEAFCELHRRWTALRTDGAAVGYLRSTVSNLARMHIRRKQVVRRRFPALTDVPEFCRSAEQSVLARHGHQAVVHALGELPRRQREAIVLRYWMGLQDTEIAEAMDISHGTVKVHIFRGMAGLKRSLADGEW